jgi:hypothetical protein
MSMCMRTLILGAAIGIAAAVTTISPTQAGMIGAGTLQITEQAPHDSSCAGLTGRARPKRGELSIHCRGSCDPPSRVALLNVSQIAR